MAHIRTFAHRIISSVIRLCPVSKRTYGLRTCKAYYYDVPPLYFAFKRRKERLVLLIDSDSEVRFWIKMGVDKKDIFPCASRNPLSIIRTELATQKCISFIYQISVFGIDYPMRHHFNMGHWQGQKPLDKGGFDCFCMIKKQNILMSSPYGAEFFFYGLPVDKSQFVYGNLPRLAYLSEGIKLASKNKESLGIGQTGKVCLCCFTWDHAIRQGQFPFPITSSILEEQNSVLASSNTYLVIKAHWLSNETKRIQHNYSNILFVSNEDLLHLGMNIIHLLALSDALVTDYSSTSLDYLPLKRPMAFFLDDLEESLHQMGRKMDFLRVDEIFPGPRIHDLASIISFAIQPNYAQFTDRAEFKYQHHFCDKNFSMAGENLAELIVQSAHAFYHS